MHDEQNILLWILTGLIGVLSTAVGYLLNRTITRLDRVEDTGDQNRLDLANFRTEVAKDYAKEASVQHQLSRIHDRIDKLPGDIVRLIRGEK